MPSAGIEAKAERLLTQRRVTLTEGSVYLVGGDTGLYVVSIIKTEQMDVAAVYCNCERGRHRPTEYDHEEDNICSHARAVVLREERRQHG